MKLTINGEPKEIANPTLTVTELLKQEGVSMPDMVTVQLNDEFLRPHQYPDVTVSDGDTINFLYFMGGGQ
ncbi:MAG: sulfur carrier protein ThiS [Verrucomicrobiales bacterium]|jgi:sulfur carrier protein|nr:sulfur carrier protein ThiS [Verrucomicrobiales bacterium]